MPKFSVIIPCFNAADTILETLASIRAQTHPSWEVGCADDGSTDLTCALIRDAQKTDPRITLVHNTGNGPSTARNSGAMTHATGDILAFCDADDLWSPTKLAELDQAFQDPAVDGAFGQIAFFATDPAKATVFSTVPAGDLTIPMLLGENPVCTMSNISLRSTAFVATGGFDEDIVHNEDLEWLIRLLGAGARVIGITSCQTYYRARANGLSADLAKMNASRRVALATAASFGFATTPAADAIYMRYLTRRALRLGQSRRDALRFALQGLRISPAGFFNSPRRGALTLIGALSALVLPRPICKFVFAR